MRKLRVMKSGGYKEGIGGKSGLEMGKKGHKENC